MFATPITFAIALAAGGPLAASHEGTVGNNAIVWQSRVLVEGPARVLLRRPLPAALPVELSGAVAERDDAGALTALRVERSGRALVDITVHEPLLREQVVLHPPLVEAVERITLLGEGVRFRPDTALGLEQRIGMFAAADVDHRARNFLEANFASPRKSNTPPLWLGHATSSELRAGGLGGSLARHTSVTLIVATLGLAAFFVVLLLAGVRVLTTRAANERADRLIDAEWREVTQRSSP